MTLTWDELKAKLPKTPAEKHLARTIALMYKAHGRLDGHNCGECFQLVVKPTEGTRRYSKCAAFLKDHPRRGLGSWGSAATDWRVGWPACGLFEARQ